MSDCARGRSAANMCQPARRRSTGTLWPVSCSDDCSCGPAELGVKSSQRSDRETCQWMSNERNGHTLAVL